MLGLPIKGLSSYLHCGSLISPPLVNFSGQGPVHILLGLHLDIYLYYTVVF